MNNCVEIYVALPERSVEATAPLFRVQVVLVTV
jgi:hypothetical protein